MQGCLDEESFPGIECVWCYAKKQLILKAQLFELAFLCKREDFRAQPVEPIQELYFRLCIQTKITLTADQKWFLTFLLLNRAEIMPCRLIALSFYRSKLFWLGPNGLVGSKSFCSCSNWTFLD